MQVGQLWRNGFVGKTLQLVTRRRPDVEALGVQPSQFASTVHSLIVSAMLIRDEKASPDVCLTTIKTKCLTALSRSFDRCPHPSSHVGRGP